MSLFCPSRPKWDHHLRFDIQRILILLSYEEKIDFNYYLQHCCLQTFVIIKAWVFSIFFGWNILILCLLWQSNEPIFVLTKQVVRRIQETLAILLMINKKFRAEGDTLFNVCCDNAFERFAYKFVSWDTILPYIGSFIAAMGILLYIWYLFLNRHIWNTFCL